MKGKETDLLSKLSQLSSSFRCVVVFVYRLSPFPIQLKVFDELYKITKEAGKGDLEKDIGYGLKT